MWRALLGLGPGVQSASMDPCLSVRIAGVAGVQMALLEWIWSMAYLQIRPRVQPAFVATGLVATGTKAHARTIAVLKVIVEFFVLPVCRATSRRAMVASRNATPAKNMEIGGLGSW